MTTYGAIWCAQDGDVPRTIRPTHVPSNCGIGAENCSWYYDGERVYYQIADYTGNTAYNQGAANCEALYRDGYIGSTGRVSGWRVFPHGLYMDYLRNKDTVSKTAVDLLAKNAAYATMTQGSLVSARSTREASYKVHVNRLDVDLGVASQAASLQRAVAYALGHIDQWAVSQNAEWVQPFMVGLNMEALIQYYEDGHQSDPRIAPAVKTMADWLWNNAWIPPNGGSTKGTGTFYYNSYYRSIGVDTTNYGVKSRSDARDLNLLIAPAYAWLFKMTGDSTYQTRGDVIWDQGVRFASVNFNGKIFSQNYRWSFDYIKWRSAPPTGGTSTRRTRR